jgi:hypothetical protein
MKKVEISLYTISELSDAAKEKARSWWRRCDEGDTFWSECAIEEAVTQGELMGIEFKERNRRWRSADGKREGVDNSPCIWWSGFSSQGDGACFEGTWRARDVKADEVAEGWGDSPGTTEIKSIAAGFAEVAARYPAAYFIVTHTGRYSHERSVDYEMSLISDGDANDRDEKIMEEIHKIPEPDSDHESVVAYSKKVTAIKERAWEKEAETEKELKELSRRFMKYIYKELEKAYEHHNSDENVDENMEINEYTFLADGKRFEA